MALQEDQLTTYVQYTAQRLVCLTTQFASSSALRIDPGSEAPAPQWGGVAQPPPPPTSNPSQNTPPPPPPPPPSLFGSNSSP